MSTTVSISSGTDDERKPLNKSTQSTVYLDAESIRVYISSFFIRLRQRITVDTLRPLSMFLGIQGPNLLCFSAEAFTPPTRHVDGTAPEKIKARLKLNFNFFLTNYALLTLGVSVVVSLLHPGMILSLSVVWLLWAFHEYLISHELIIFGKNIGTMTSISNRSVFLSIVTTLVIIWKCLIPFLTVVMTSGFLIFIHAIMRDPKHVDSCNDYSPSSGSVNNNSRHGSGVDSDSESYDMANDSDDDRVIVERGDVI